MAEPRQQRKIFILREIHTSHSEFRLLYRVSLCVWRRRTILGVKRSQDVPTVVWPLAIKLFRVYIKLAAHETNAPRY